MTILLQGAGLQVVTAAPSGPVPILDLEADIGLTISIVPFAGTGAIAQSGNVVIGGNTKFVGEVSVGDVISSASINGIVQSITSDGILSLDTSTEQASDIPYTIIPQEASARIVTWSDQTDNEVI